MINRRFNLLISFLAAVLLSLGATQSAGAQGMATTMAAQSQDSSDASSAAPTQADINELIRLLSNPGMVDWLKKNADEQDGQTADDSARLMVTTALERARVRLALIRSAAANIAETPDLLREAWRIYMPRGETLRSIVYVLVFMFTGAGFEWLYWQYAGGRMARLEAIHQATVRQRALAVLQRLALVGGGLAVFIIASAGAFIQFEWAPFIQSVVINLLLAIFALRALIAATTMIFAPRVPALRLVPMGDAMTRRVTRHVRIFGFIAIVCTTIADTFTRLADVAANDVDGVRAAALAVAILMGLIIMVALVAMIWRLHLTGAARTKSHGALFPSYGNVATVVLTVAAIAAFLFRVVDARALEACVLILAILPLTIRASRLVIDHLYDQVAADEAARLAKKREADAAIAEEQRKAAETETIEAEPVDPAMSEPAPDLEGEAEDAEARALETSPARMIAVRAARFVLVVVALALIAANLNVGPFSEAPTTRLTDRITRVIVDLIVALMIADLIWAWAKAAIDRRLANYEPPRTGQPPGPEARMATLLPLLRKGLVVTLFIFVGFSLLSGLGIDIGPLLAGAGVIGIAIGFGTQALVRDIVSGIFFLLDDAFRVGEYIEIGNLRGTVESMSIRSLRVRHHRGAIHTIPFGELTSLTNYSRDWVIMKMEFRVPFETDLKLVKKLIKQVSAELQANETYGQHFIEPLKSQGVRRMEEFNMVVGVKFMAKPGEQWLIRRDAYQKIRDIFEKNGIHFAQRNVKVEVVSEKPLPEEVREAVAGAAEDAIAKQAGDTPPGPPPDEP